MKYFPTKLHHNNTIKGISGSTHCVSLPIFKEHNTIFIKPEHYNFYFSLTQNACYTHYNVPAMEYKIYQDNCFKIEGRKKIISPWILIPVHDLNADNTELSIYTPEENKIDVFVGVIC